ncbi:hypothetical protein RB653_006190 [Dictyostelium firmibasis]|uniref:Saposin B-type domain-containing protein n=1 Tax=Dictyostelium firmibasis TaxID=79012 RepID=A0AAN7U8Z5_9MYCE
MKFLIFVLLALIALSASTSVVSAQTKECEFCDFIVGCAEKYIERNESVTVTELEKVCKYAGEYQATCDSLISTYGNELIQLLVNKEPASVICSQVKACTSEEKKKLGTVECTICTFAVQEIEGFIANNSTENEIVTKLDDECSKFGGLSTTCQSIIKEYVPEFIQLLNNKQNPNQVCDEVKLCTNSVNSPRLIKRNTFRI